MKQQSTVPVIKTWYRCDECLDRAVHRCWGCENDLCDVHTSAVLFNHPFFGCDNGDYPEYLCYRCQELLENVRTKGRK